MRSHPVASEVRSRLVRASQVSFLLPQKPDATGQNRKRSTIRLQILKLATRIEVTAKRVWVPFSESDP